MTRIKHWLKTNLDLVANVLLSIGAFVILCGWRALDFTNINLVMTSSQKFFAHLIPAAHLPAGKEYLRHVAMASGDKTCSYLSNMVYRSDPFSWDIFRIHSLNPPDGMAGVSTCLAPLWSLFFKFLGVFGFDPYWQTEGLFTLV